MKRLWPASPEWLTSLFDPRLVGAACVGQPELFDDFRDGETFDQADARHRDALMICGRCPVRPRCATAADELGGKARGVWGGTVRNMAGRAGRPRKKDPR